MAKNQKTPRLTEWSGIIKKGAKSIKAYVDVGADPNEVLENGESPLQTAIRKASFGSSGYTGTPAIRTLLQVGANPNFQSQEHGVPTLVFATGILHAPAIELLLAAGGNAGLSSKRGTNPLHGLCLGAHYSIPDDLPAEIIDALIDAGADLFAYDEAGYLPLHYLMNLRATGVTLRRKVLTLYPDIDSHVTKTGWTPLAACAKTGITNEIYGTLQVQHLLNCGANPNVQVTGDPESEGQFINADGDTLLHLATFHLRYSMISILLRGGADPTIKNNKGLTCLDVARLNYPERQDLFAVLERKTDNHAFAVVDSDAVGWLAEVPASRDFARLSAAARSALTVAPPAANFKS